MSRRTDHLEVEIGVVGVKGGWRGYFRAPEKRKTIRRRRYGRGVQGAESIGGRYMLAATFGNVHGIYKPGNVVLKPKILKEGRMRW